jgi:chloramphenicol O-acetyltransferase type B
MNKKNYIDDWNDDSYCNKLDPQSIILKDCEVSNSTLKAYSRLKKNVEFRNSALGDYSYVSSFSVINACDIGKFCSIAHGTFIGLWEHNTYTTTHSFYLYESSGGLVKGFKDYDKDEIRTKIGNDVWVGANVTIKKGVSIGDGAIIGAGSVVTKDVEPYSIVVGLPAKLMKKRFEQRDIDLLLKSQWWDYPREILKDMIEKNVWDSMVKLRNYILNKD